MRLGMSSSIATSSVPRIGIAGDGKPALASFVGVQAGPMPASRPKRTVCDRNLRRLEDDPTVANS